MISLSQQAFFRKGLCQSFVHQQARELLTATGFISTGLRTEVLHLVRLNMTMSCDQTFNGVPLELVSMSEVPMTGAEARPHHLQSKLCSPRGSLS